MTPGEREALELLDIVGRNSPDAVRLAQIVSLAARIEPELLRQARLKLLPEADAGAEADLWFSPLVQSATPVALVLLPDVEGLLRRRLSQSGPLLQRSWKLLQRVHEHAPAAIKLEEEVTWRALSGAAGAEQWIERELMSVVSAIVNQGRSGLARWALRALPRLPAAARRTKGATMLALASAARFGAWQLLGEQVKGKHLRPGTLSQLRVVLPPDLPQVAVGVRLFEEGSGGGSRTRKGAVVTTGIEFTSPPAQAEGLLNLIEAPATTPLLLEVSWGEGSRRVVKHVGMYQGQTETLEVGGSPITVRTARGDVYTLHRDKNLPPRRVSGTGHVMPASLIPRAPVIGFVSRRDAQGRDLVARLREELAPGRARLVTLSGPGGTGKTILAAEAARALLEPYDNRVVWSSADGRADFSLLSLLDDIAIQLGRAELRTLSPSEKEKQVRALAADALVVLDNYQTVAGAEQRLIEAWLRRTKCSSLLTSRTRIRGTSFIPVSTLSREEAAEFLARLVEQTQEPYMFTPEVRDRIYQTAEGNPYVMQWVVAQIYLAQEPDEVLKALQDGEGAAAERLFDRSFNLPQLGDDGRNTLLALSLFAPSASREALTAVADLGDNRKRLDDAVKNLRALWLVNGVDDNRRLAVEGLTRSLAAARLAQDPRAEEFRRRFIAYFQRFAEERREPTPENYDALEGEFDNVMGAIESAFVSEDWQEVVGLCDAVGGFLDTRGYWDEALRRSKQAQSAALKAKLSEPRPTQFAEVAANIHLRRGEYALAKRGFYSVLKRYEKAKYEIGIAQALRHLGNIALEQNNLGAAQQFYTQSLEISRRINDPKNLADNLHNLAVVLQAQGELRKARSLYDEALAISRRLGDRQSVATTEHQLGVAAAEMGDRTEARRLYDESLKINRILGAQEAVASTLHQLGRLTIEEGNLYRAAGYLEQALEIFEALGSPAAAEARKELNSVRNPIPSSPPAKSASKRAPVKKKAAKASKLLREKAPSRSTGATKKSASKKSATKKSVTKKSVKGVSAKASGGFRRRIPMRSAKRGGFSGRSGRRTK